MLTSRTRAMTPAAMGAEAEVPVCEVVHLLCRSVDTIFLSPEEPELETDTDTLCKTKVNVGKGCLQVRIFLFFSSSCRPWINLPDVHYLQLEPKNINYVDAMVEEQASEYQGIITCTLLP